MHSIFRAAEELACFFARGLSSFNDHTAGHFTCILSDLTYRLTCGPGFLCCLSSSFYSRFGGLDRLLPYIRLAGLRLDLARPGLGGFGDCPGAFFDLFFDPELFVDFVEFLLRVPLPFFKTIFIIGHISPSKNFTHCASGLFALMPIRSPNDLIFASSEQVFNSFSWPKGVLIWSLECW